MNDLQTIFATLRNRWDHKLPKLIATSRNFAVASLGRLRANAERHEVEKAIREAFSAGYREGYWEGVVDVVECGSNSEREPPSRAAYPVH